MTIDSHNGRYRHDVERWTVGQLRAALRELPEDAVLRVEVAHAPSTGHPDPWGNDEFVVTDAMVDDEDEFGTGDLVLRVDYSSDWYMLPDAVGPQPVYLPVLANDDGEPAVPAEVAFPAESEAQRVLDAYPARRDQCLS